MPGQFWPDVSHQLHLVTFSCSVLINSCEQVIDSIVKCYYINFHILIIIKKSQLNQLRLTLSKLSLEGPSLRFFSSTFILQTHFK